MTIERKLLGTTPVSSGDSPEAVSFDGTSDYLSRSSDLTGNSDGKTCTFSCWVYIQDGDNTTYAYRSSTSGTTGFQIHFSNGDASSQCYLYLYNSGGTRFIRGSMVNIPKNTWTHILWSIDASDINKRHGYTNDVDDASWAQWADDSVAFSRTLHEVASYDANTYNESRLSNLFLDYTYRDLSVTANRRLFIDADGKPSKTIPSSPILYLPMTDAATAGSNSGTGGDFTVNGVLATADRGPNQDNCSASTFDGSNDYMTRASIGASNSKVFTVSGTINVTGGDGLVCKFYKNGHGTLFQITTNIYGSLYIKAYDASYQNRFYVQWKNSIGANNALMPNHNYHFSLSVDMSDTSKRHLIINGAAVSPTYTYYTDVEMGFSAIDLSRVGFVSGDGYFAGDLGELYFNTTYTDLSTDNPFWDSDANRPNSVRKVIADTSVTPLVALPMIGSDAGNNLGTGGDFNVVSGPYAGARGGSEYWSRTAKFDGFNGGNALKRDSSLGTSTSSLSGVAFFKPTTDNEDACRIFEFSNSGSHRFSIVYNQSQNSIRVIGNDSSSGQCISGPTDSGTGGPYSITVTHNVWHTLFFSLKSNSDSDCLIVFDGTSYGASRDINAPFDSSSSSNLDLGSANRHRINAGSDANPSDDRHQLISFIYTATSYIDFSQEANRNKFVNQLGYPRDLTQQIEDEDIPNPLIYMKFDPSVSLGTNSGTGGDFTVNGTVTSGADFTP